MLYVSQAPVSQLGSCGEKAYSQMQLQSLTGDKIQKKKKKKVTNNRKNSEQ